MTAELFDTTDYSPLFAGLPVPVDEPAPAPEAAPCHLAGMHFAPEKWQTRPTEDALRAHIAELAAATRPIPFAERWPEFGQTIWLWNGKSWFIVPNWSQGHVDDFEARYTHWLPYVKPSAMDIPDTTA